MNRILIVLLAVTFISATPGILRAASEPESSESAESKKFSESVLSTRNPASDLVVSGSVQPRKRYPGGADEDDLQVQAVLPNPSRGLEAHDAAVNEAAASSSGEAPASD
jgi:hypothetical protein